MMNRKLAATVMAAALLTGVATASVAAAASVPGAVYSDSQASGASKPVQQVTQELAQAGVKDVQPTAWYAGSMTVLVQSGLIQPDANGKVNPEAPLTAGEGVAVFAKVLNIASKTDSPEVALAKAQSAGLVGSSTTVTTDLSRLDVAKLLAKALGVTPKLVLAPTDFPFNDGTGMSAEDQGILAALHDMGIFKGYEDRTFRPTSILTKAEIAILVDRILGAK